ncbi:MAG TPA: hypothetical protein VLY04_05915 [Bryobacteraceae bacterium]|nr:hypothetical protein [Bryobacteraceae bacterium]
MIQTVQLSIADGQYAATVREALARSCAWHVEPVERPDLGQHCVMVLDEQAFARLPLPLSNPERVVLVTRREPQDPQFLAQAWEAGIVSIVSEQDPINTVLLAIMAAALRVAKSREPAVPSGITPSSSSGSASIAPPSRISGSKRCKTQ